MSADRYAGDWWHVRIDIGNQAYSYVEAKPGDALDKLVNMLGGQIQPGPHGPIRIEYVSKVEKP